MNKSFNIGVEATIDVIG